MNKLRGKTALITGGTSGIGLATAKAFVNEGAYTFITGRREAELAAAVKEIGRNVTGIQGDATSAARKTLVWFLRRSTKLICGLLARSIAWLGESPLRLTLF